VSQQNVELVMRLQPAPRRADDVGGIAVHIGSRVAAQAQADEVLVSSTVKDLVAGSRIGMPAFKLRGKTIAGFAAFKSDLSYLPHNGSVIGQLEKETEGYTKTKGSLHFPVDEPLPKELVKKLLDTRMAEAFGRRR
jgi:uncharacterized protein YdhG (YjbR/CyaY superfamily)